MKISELQLKKAFDELGVGYTEQITNKCLEICNTYNVSDAEEFVDNWVAYSVSHFQGDDPSLSNLDKFERDEFSNKKLAMKHEESSNGSSLIIYNSAIGEKDIQDSESILGVYNPTTPKARNQSKRIVTPDLKNRNYVPNVFSPASFSPSSATPSSKYVSRTNSGDVVCKFNDEMECTSSDRCELTDIQCLSGSLLDQKYMSYDLTDCLTSIEDNIEKLSNLIVEKFSLEDVMSINYKHPTPFVTVGVVSCDADGRLNSKSVLLEGTRDMSDGEVVQLDLSAVDRYSIFPGQVVAVEGVNATGKKLVAQRIYHDLPVQAPDVPTNFGGSLQMIVASGPYTQSDTMTYQPLLDLTNIIVRDKPNVVLLTGPFVDASHPHIVDNTIAETFHTLFIKLVDQIMSPLENLPVEVVLVPSYRDAHGDMVYPTPAFNDSFKKNKNLHFVPDPCILDINGLLIGVTSTDILMHLGKEEISCPPHSADRLSRLANHVISQRSFYPLNPPAEEVPLDPTMIQFANLNVIPHVLILPSDLRYFIKEVSGCYVVNPERLAKGVIGGTFAHLQLSAENSKLQVKGSIVKI